MLDLHAVVLDDMVLGWRKDEAPTEHSILLLVARGQLTYRLNGAELALHKGDLLYIPQGTLRSASNDPQGPHQKYSAHFLAPAPPALPLPDPAAIWLVRARNSDYLHQRFALIAQHWYGRLPHARAICTGGVIELLGLMGRELEMDRYSAAKRRLVEAAQAYLIARYREPLRLDELARHLQRSPNYVTQTYREVTGMTPTAYVHHLRIQAARDLILTAGKTIGETSDYLGFSDQAHFNRVFKKQMGYPPSALLRGRSHFDA
ncbi:helix-turn-helix transcriptional regulator [Paenibacillus sp. IB182496]|uniref:Helix-turn-helix transcriptional regulator n=1 Tax=Paenibacillus sabuli TaxID=2772509 RepID=A0A927BRF8_9BACL|nr:AraC family transcriptional regulator [Paenibacillus sabuli]MBD2844179.1 helix-turn-helix transcriptional regulator [Paenibacillus sabuli]